jgi:hypothetical protein
MKRYTGKDTLEPLINTNHGTTHLWRRESKAIFSEMQMLARTSYEQERLCLREEYQD